MRLAKSSRSLLPLILSAVLATCAWAQDRPTVQPNAVRQQLTNPAPGTSHTPSAPRPAAPAPAKPAATANDSTQAAPGNSANPQSEKAAGEKAVTRRDPFDTLLSKARAGGGAPDNLPPGKAGLIVETLRIDGIVHSPNGMIAIVSNAQQRVYFLREGDKLYDGSVEKIALDAISFQEIGKDAFGKPLERTVTKRLYPSSGEQQ